MRKRTVKQKQQSKCSYVIQAYKIHEEAATMTTGYKDWETARRVALALADYYDVLELFKYPASVMCYRFKNKAESVSFEALMNGFEIEVKTISRNQFKTLNEPPAKAWITELQKEEAFV